MEIESRFVRRLIITDQAIADLTEISGYIADTSGNRTTAERFAEALLHRCEKLAALPGTLGRARPELRPDVRSIAHKSYVIFFRYSDDRVEIVSILNGLRDIDALFDDQPANR